MSEYFHSVTLQKEKCVGCTDCIKRCPTEAIRVRNGKAIIINERCIDCGMCIRVCRNHAKKATTDPLEIIHRYSYKVALPAPTLYSQFKDVVNVNLILSALKKIGFNEVYEVARAAEIVSEESIDLLKGEDIKKPVISSACPAIVRLIQIRFPSLIPNILPLISPMEAAARIVKRQLEDKGIPEEEIGVFFISPCAAKVTNIRKPQGYEESFVDGVISMRDIYMTLVPVLKSIDKPESLAQSSRYGIGWAANGGEGNCLGIENYIAVDGIENVIKVFEKVENGKLGDVDFIEGLACIGGCLGGPLSAENCFVAKNRLGKVKSYAKKQERIYKESSDRTSMDMKWSKTIHSKPVLSLDEDMLRAIEKMEQIEQIYKRLPQIDCGSCGAPTCRALAEDIVRKQANLEDCIFMLRQKVREMAQEMVALSQKLPPAIGKEKI